MVDIGEALTRAWKAFTKYPWLLIGGSLLWLVLAPLALLVPIADIWIAPPMYAGLILLLMAALRDTRPNMDELFAGFRRMKPWMGVFWLWFLISTVANIPYFLAAIPSAGKKEPTGPEVLLLFGGLGVSMVLAAIATTIWGFAFFLVADGMGTMDAFRESATMTRGHRLQLLLLLIILMLVYMAGYMVCCVGALVSIPVAAMAWIAAYDQLRGRRSAGEGPVPGTKGPA